MSLQSRAPCVEKLSTRWAEAGGGGRMRVEVDGGSSQVLCLKTRTEDMHRELST